MPFNYTIASTGVTTTKAVESVRLFHGGVEEGVFSIINHGLDAKRAMVFGGTGDFWLTSEFSQASVFALTTHTGGTPVILGVDLPVGVLDRCLSHGPHPWAWRHDEHTYEFYPASFQVLTMTITNLTITYIQE
jgi:hypothetical protein